MSFINIHDNKIAERIRKKAYCEWLIDNGENPNYARQMAYSRIKWIIANDPKLPEGKRRQAWVGFFMSNGDDLKTARIKACKKIPH